MGYNPFPGAVKPPGKDSNEYASGQHPALQIHVREPPLCWLNFMGRKSPNFSAGKNQAGNFSNFFKVVFRLRSVEKSVARSVHWLKGAFKMIWPLLKARCLFDLLFSNSNSTLLMLGLSIITWEFDWIQAPVSNGKPFCWWHFRWQEWMEAIF